MPLEKRFWAKVNRGGPLPLRDELGPCWIWTAAIWGKGYGMFEDGDGTHRMAHRMAWRLSGLALDDELQLDHLCLVKACVRPSHLEPVTNAENARRAKELRTACRRDHPFTEENTVIRPDGTRTCRICRNDSIKRFHERHPNYRQLGPLSGRGDRW